MKSITVEKIKIKGIDNILNILNIDFLIKANEHSKAMLKLDMKDGYQDILNSVIFEHKVVDIINENNNELLFSGYIKEFEDDLLSDTNNVIVELISSTIELDFVKNKRIFQNVNSTFSNVIEEVGSSANANISISIDDRSIEFPIVQYEETDWEFLKKLAGRMGKSLVPFPSYKGICLEFGMKSKKVRTFNSNFCKCGVSENYYKIGGPLSGYSKLDFKYYIIKTYENYDIGDIVLYNGEKTFVTSKEAHLINGELIFEYTIGQEVLNMQKRCESKFLSGLTLKGRVLETSEDKIKVNINIDSKQSRGAEYNFDWFPNLGKELYCMPEAEENVNLLFWNCECSKASSDSSLYSNTSNCTDNTRKVFMYNNKTLDILPDKIEFSVNDIADKLYNLDILDNSTINLTSKKPIKIKSTNNINITASVMNIAAPQQITIGNLVNPLNTICINQTIDIKGIDVSTVAKARKAFEPFNDAPVVCKKELSKILLKLAFAVLAVAVVAAVAAIAAAAIFATGGAAAVALVGITATTAGGAAASAAGAVVAGAAIAGAVGAGISVFFQIRDDSSKKITRDWTDYLYLGVDQFCTGAIIAAPVSTPIPFLGQLVGVGLGSLYYQSVDSYLDDKYGSDFYDQDGNVIVNMIFDLLGAGIAKGVSTLVNKGFEKICSRLTHLSKADTMALANFANKYLGKNYNVRGGRNATKRAIRTYFDGKVNSAKASKFVNNVILGGIDVPGTAASDSNINFVIGNLNNKITESVNKNQYDEMWANREPKTYFKFDENNNLIYE